MERSNQGLHLGLQSLSGTISKKPPQAGLEWKFFQFPKTFPKMRLHRKTDGCQSQLPDQVRPWRGTRMGRGFIAPAAW
jgi:hypothetical protein